MAKSRADAVMSTIESGHVGIRSGFSLLVPKIVRGGFLWIMLAILVGLYIVLSVWIATNSDLLSSYGQMGFWSFLQAFPYIPLLLTIPVLGAFLLAIRAYDISYKKPLLGIVLGGIAVSVVAAGLLGANKDVAQVVSQNSRMFGMGQMAGKNFLIGTVQAYKDNELVVQQDDGSMVSIRLLDDTHYPFGTPSVGDTVRVVGDTSSNGIFEAVGVRVFGDDSFYGAGQGERRMDGSGQGKGKRNALPQPSLQVKPTGSTTPEVSNDPPNQNGSHFRRGREQNIEITQ